MFYSLFRRVGIALVLGVVSVPALADITLTPTDEQQICEPHWMKEVATEW
ncbi:hypothetical protein [Citrobacter enshiensis]|nr:hypothetical protein [Citrobacter enshiensis]WET39526.1 hypothetical protein P2W74_16310 [Citrobacter enshiensis]